MPLRDHFGPPVNKRNKWGALHAGWPMMLVLQLRPILPKGFVAEPGVHLGAAFEIDVSAYEREESERFEQRSNGNGGVAVATWAPPKPTLTLETEVPDQDEYEVRIYDEEYGRLVAAIEIVSPSNKDRPESRELFVAKIADLVQHDVCVSIVDLVTIRHFNLYGDLLEVFSGTDPLLGDEPPSIYAATVRGRMKGKRKRLSLYSWFYPMNLGQTLPTLPIWLDVDKGVLLNLETSYEETCRALSIA
jgi:hypothetical protein